MRIIFCGTPDFAVPSLRRLLVEPDVSVLAVVTQPDRPRGRGQHLASPPVKEIALAGGIPVFQPSKIRTEEARRFFAEHAPDFVIIIAYGRIVPPELLAIPRLGWINLHASLLPHYRGAAPIQRAILNGETRTGITTMRIDAGLDTGPILEQLELEIGPDETAPELFTRLGEAGPDLVLSTLRRLQSGEIVPIPQNHDEATLAPPLKKMDGKISWELPAAQIYKRIRGLQPWPGAYTSFRGHTCHVWGSRSYSVTSDQAGAITGQGGEYFVACGEGTTLRLESLQIEGRKRLSAAEFARGARFQPGERFR